MTWFIVVKERFSVFLSLVPKNKMFLFSKEILKQVGSRAHKNDKCGYPHLDMCQNLLIWICNSIYLCMSSFSNVKI